MTNETRGPVVAGQFYPADSQRLRATVETYLARAPQCSNRALRALIAPHAGYHFSGPTAGAAFCELRNRVAFSRVVVLAPSHRHPSPTISAGTFKEYATPLGGASVDARACEALIRAGEPFSADTTPHNGEHSLEVQLPFLQVALPEAKLVPLVCGPLDTTRLRSAAAVLREQLWRPDTLWVISTDFTHFGSAFGYEPFTENVAQRLEELDLGVAETVRELSPDPFLRYLDDTGATVCGRVPVALLLAVAEPEREQLTCELLEYTNTGKITGDYSHAVSYAAMGVYGKAEGNGSATEDNEDGTSADSDERLSLAERRTLLAFARDAIAGRLEHREGNVDESEVTEALRRERACFVTLHKNGRLRGCIGALEPTEELYRNVIHNARNAAFQDPRFPQVTADELDDIDLEISVLTLPRPISGPRQFEVGRHGILLEKGPNRSVFLPQVATEQGWDRETTLNYLAMKAGLPEHGWRHGVRFRVFEAIVFGESEFQS